MRKIISALIFIAVIAGAVILFTHTMDKTSEEVYKQRRATEVFDTLDFYSMQDYCEQNAYAVMDAMKNKDSAKLSELTNGADGIDKLLSFADWSKADFDSATSMGAGSLKPAPDENGRMEISERFYFKVGDTKYIIFVETVTSRWGRDNDGVSAVAVTTFDHFDATGYAWNGEADDNSVMVGELFYKE